MGPLPAAAEASSSVPYSPLPGLMPQVIVGPVASYSATQRPSGAFRLKIFLIACCRRPGIRKQYDLCPCMRGGDTSKGQMVVIFDSFRSPAIRQDLATFGQAFSLPAGADVEHLPAGGAVTCNDTHVGSPGRLPLRERHHEDRLGLCRHL
jgi:hypothetical protein